MSIYADKKPKVSSKNGRKKSSSSIYYDLPSKTFQKPFWLEGNKTSKDDPDSKSSDDRMKYLMKKYREIVHYNSPEPERYGARAFTKNSEIYIAPSEESALPHELAHVYQQKTQNIPATGEINGEKVNTDPKLEKEADKISKNVGGYIPRVIISGKRQANSNNVMQFAPPDNKDDLLKLANEESKSSEMSFDSMIQKPSKIIPMLKKHLHLVLADIIASAAILIYWLKNRLKEQKRIKEDKEQKRISNIDKMLN